MRADDLRRALSELAQGYRVNVPNVETVARRGRRRLLRRRALASMTALALVAVIATIAAGTRATHRSSVVVGPTTLPSTRTSLTAPTPVTSKAPNAVIFTSATEGWLCADPILHTADAGRSWQAAAYDQIVRDRSNRVCGAAPGGDLWFVVGTRPPVLVYVQGGSDISGDEPLTDIPPDRSISQITFIDRQHGWLVASSTDGTASPWLYRSADSGLRWTLVTRDAPNEIAFSTPTDGWGVGTRGDTIEQTIDGGATWHRRAVPLPPPVLQHGLRLDVAVSGSSIVVDGTNVTGLLASKFFVNSNDGGRTWTLHDEPSMVVGGTEPTSFTTTDATHWWFVPSEPSKHSLWVTQDAGATWQLRATPGGTTAGVAFPTATDGWAIADGRLHHTTDQARTWQTVEPVPQPDWHTQLVSVPTGCPNEPITSPPPNTDRLEAAIGAARDFVLRTRGWTGERVAKAYPVRQGDPNGLGGIFAYNIPRFCGSAVADGTYGIELANDTITLDNSRYTALVAAHFANGWRVWGFYR